MAYSEHTITNLTDIPPLVHTFATGLGLNVTGTTGVPIIRNPNYMGAGPGGLAFQLTTSISGVNNDLTWTATSGVSGFTPSSKIRSPILATDVAPTVGVAQPPTKVFLIGMLAPQPYLAIIVEYGYNLHRHLYVGFMEKIGNYLGGEVLSSQNGPVLTSSSAVTDLTTSNCKNHMFSARQTLWNTTGGCGGVHISHADNAKPWRNFYCPNSIYGNIATSVFAGGEVIGGYGDAINDPLVAKAHNGLAGVTLMTPVDLYAVQPVTGDVRFRPIGRPSGVRLCNIRDLEPQVTLAFGAETWKVFAACAKGDTDEEPRAGTSSGLRYRKYESTGHLGIAYRSN